MQEKLYLNISGVDVYYEDFQALWDVSLVVRKGEIASIIGANGAGKSTLLNTISGQLKPTKGTIEFNGIKIGGFSSYETVNLGITLVPEGRGIFPRLTVYENLIIGSYPRRTRASRQENINKLYELFPILSERRNQMGNTLSGGEQQMLALGRAMMSDPSLILCDEVSLGLAPFVIKDIYKRLRQINKDGITIVLVEQDVKRSLREANRAYVMLEGKIVLEGDPSTLTDDEVYKAYFGMTPDRAK